MAAMPEGHSGPAWKGPQPKNPENIFARFPAENGGFRPGWPAFSPRGACKNVLG